MFNPWKKKRTLTKITFKEPVLIKKKKVYKWTTSRHVKLTFKPKTGLVKVFMRKTDIKYKRVLYLNMSKIVSIQQINTPVSVKVIQTR